MAAGTRSIDSSDNARVKGNRNLEPAHRLRALGIGAVYVVCTAALLRGVRMFFGNPMASTVLGAAAVSLVVARAGVRTARFTARARARMLIGVGLVLGVVCIGVGTALATGATLATGEMGTSAFFGVIESLAIGYSYELWLRGIPLHFAERAKVGVPWAFAFSTLAGVAAVALEPGAKPVGLVLTAAASAFFTALWLRSKDGYAAISAHVVWAWASDAAISGEIFELAEQGSRLTHTPSADGLSAGAAAAAFVLLAAAVMSHHIPLWRWEAIDFPEDP